MQVIRTLNYWNPAPRGKLLVVSGIHGDEWGVIRPLLSFVDRRRALLPSTFFIPEMSPSAINARRRQNIFGHDLNRIFGMHIEDDERKDIEKVVKENGPYDLVVSFHEDPVYPETYLYDVGQQFYELDLEGWRVALKELGVRLLTGLDDPNDPTLCYEFVDGYNYDNELENNGTFEYWVIVEKLAKRSLTIEIPSGCSTFRKSQLVQKAFEYLILPAFQEKEKTNG